MSKIYNTQNWRLICATGEDQTTASTIEILAQIPGSSIETFTATLDTDTTRIYYDVGVSEMATAGNYKVWPKTTIAGNIAPGEAADVIVYKEGR